MVTGNYRTPDWEDFVGLAITEIRHCGRDSIQITRRIRAMLEELIEHACACANTAERLDALIGDNQYGVRVIVKDLRMTVDNLRVLSETVKRYPAGAILGGPPEKVQLPGSSR